MTDSFAEQAAHTLARGIGRRGFLQAAAAMGAGMGTLGVASCSTADPAGTAGSTSPGAPGAIPILQPGTGTMSGQHYLSSVPDQVLWGYVPTVESTSVLTMRSGETVTIDALSHEGILEDQGRNPLEYFGAKGVTAGNVLSDAVDVAADYRRTTRNFDVDGRTSSPGRSSSTARNAAMS